VAPDVDAHAGSDATWRAELEAMVEEAKSGGVDGSLTQSA